MTWADAWADWLSPTALWWLGIVALCSLVGSVIVLPLVVVWMPADYFVRRQPPAESWRRRHRAVYAIALIAKNVLGVVLVLAGTIMLFTPGQGVVTLVVRLSLLDLPGKRPLERRLIASPPLRRALDGLRRRAHRPPLELPPG